LTSWRREGEILQGLHDTLKKTEGASKKKTHLRFYKVMAVPALLFEN